MKTQERTSTTWPEGWLATSIGGTLGAVALGTVGYVAAVLYVDMYQDGGLEDLFTLFVGTATGVFIGAVVGAAAALRFRHHRYGLGSGLLFAIFGAVLLVTLGFMGNLAGPGPVKDAAGMLAAFVFVPAGAAMLARKLMLLRR